MNSPIFSLSPFYAAADKTLGHAAHRVLTLLCGFADPEGLCFPSRKMLCHLTGIENSNLSKYINVLCRKGYLEKVNASGNRYKIIGFKDKQWPMVECGNNYHHENQQHGNNYHENISCGNNYHDDGNSYHEDGNNYHKTGDSVVMITNRTYQKINRPIEQTNEQTSGAVAPCVSSPPTLFADLPEPPVVAPLLPKKSAKPKAVSIEEFSLNDDLREWANKNGFKDLDRHLEHFKDYVRSSGKNYKDLTAAFRNAVRNNWAKVDTSSQKNPINGKHHPIGRIEPSPMESFTNPQGEERAAHIKYGITLPDYSMFESTQESLSHAA